MKKILLIIFGILVFQSTATAQSMISLKKYTEQNSNNYNDPVVMTYVLKRCASAYLYAAAITRPKNENQATILLSAYEKLTMFAGEILMKKMNYSEEVASKSIITDLDNMVKNYEKDGNDSFAKTGTYMMNNYIGDDLKTCKGVVESIQ